MAELIPAPFADLVSRLYAEPRAQDSLFGLPRKKWYVPAPDEPDMSVRFHGRIAGNAVGPAAGPHTQMAQNLLLSYAAGSRILELKTVQVNDRLKIGRPCIDMTNVGYNIEWSQELLVEQSLREYVAGMMLIEMLRRDPQFAGDALMSRAGEYIFDISVGYDLAGIRSEKVQMFLDGLRDATAMIEQLRREIPSQYELARNLEYPTKISSTVTLSTFHGCPADEIERICEFLIAQRELDVIVKMNPPMLGKDRLEHLLYDVLGYTDLTVNPEAYKTGLHYDQGVQLVARLRSFAKAHGKGFGCKFSNTLEVLNHRTFFTPDNKVQYLSGQPLHVITMTLTDEFRRSIGPDVPISFSAGIDRQNFPLAVACGFVPVTVCSDLLRPGGYGRLPAYLKTLADAMRAVGAANVEQYILRAFSSDRTDVGEAALHNTSVVAEKARQDPRYRADRNRKPPTRIESHLVTFDCITCDKCIPVCPNAANFTYPTPLVCFDYHDIAISSDGATSAAPTSRRFEITRPMQIACFLDFCNECGNCDTFCPEYGGPYIQKPGFFGSVETWRNSTHDGFALARSDGKLSLSARIRGDNYQLLLDPARGVYEYSTGAGRAILRADDHSLIEWRPISAAEAGEHVLDMGVYHTMRYLLAGVSDRSLINQVNVRP